MQSTCVHRLSPLCTISCNLSSRKVSRFNQKSRTSNLFITSAYDENQNGRVVDENMIVLRMRIRDIKMAESNDDRQHVPEKWMEWEKRYSHQSYTSDITKGIGILQLMLMETRPSVALGMLAFVLFSLSYTMMVVVLMLVDMAKFVIG